jgi:hypothetical protein
MKNVVFWDVMPCGSWRNRRFGGTSVLTRATRRHIPQDYLLHILVAVKAQVSMFASLTDKKLLRPTAGLCESCG